MKSYQILFIVMVFFSFTSCTEEQEDTISENLVYSVFEISNGQNRDFQIYTSAGTESFEVNSNNYSFTSKTYSATAISGTTFYYQLQIGSVSNIEVNGCVDVNIKTYHNNSLYETIDYNIGYINFPTEPCDDISYFVAQIYGIIAD